MDPVATNEPIARILWGHRGHHKQTPSAETPVMGPPDFKGTFVPALWYSRGCVPTRGPDFQNLGMTSPRPRRSFENLPAGHINYTFTLNAARCFEMIGTDLNLVRRLYASEITHHCDESFL